MVNFGKARRRLLPLPRSMELWTAAPGLCRVSLRPGLRCWGCCGGLGGTGEGWGRLVCALCGL